ncbi:MAG: DUF5694 domain-containing protein [Saprospiraceae bacterium]|nr:DUF5694 domain-containing protein [Saprospiraceae bacterium]
MKRYLLLFTALIIVFYLTGQDSINKTEILLLGTFHFANPGLDVAKFENANILTDKRQQEVETLAAQLIRFKPEKIFIETPATAQKRYDSPFTAYKNGAHTLTTNENQQLGFRVAKGSGLSGLICADYNQVSFPIDRVMKIMVANRQMDLLQYFQSVVQQEQNSFNEVLKTKTITQIILDGNTNEEYTKLAGMYYFFLNAGDKTNHAGSFLVSEQWRRNSYIYENILKNLDGKEKRILILYGTTHVAMLKEMMKYNERFKFIPVASVLK